MTKPRIYLSSPHMGGDELPLVQPAVAKPMARSSFGCVYGEEA